VLELSASMSATNERGGGFCFESASRSGGRPDGMDTLDTSFDCLPVALPTGGETARFNGGEVTSPETAI
jgi:hypothetical protein